MTARRSVAVVALLLMLLVAYPGSPKAEVWSEPESYPGLVQAYSVPGSQAQIASNRLLVAGQGAINAYGLTSGTLVTSVPLQGEVSELLAAGSYLLSVTEAGTLHATRLNDLSPAFSLELGNAGTNAATYMSVPDDGSSAPVSLAVARGNTLTLVNTLTQQISWRKQLPVRSVVQGVQHVASGNVLLHFKSNDVNYLAVYSQDGKERYLVSASEVAPAVDDKYPLTTEAVYFVHPNGFDVMQLNLQTGATSSSFRAERKIEGLRVTGDYMIIQHDNEQELYYTPTGYHHTLFSGSAASKAYRLHENSYMFVGASELAIYTEFNGIMWATQLGTATTSPTLEGFEGHNFALKLREDEIAVYLPVKQDIQQITLQPYWKRIYSLSHQQDGPIGIDLFRDAEGSPYVPLRYQLEFQATGAAGWQRISSGVLDEQVVSLTHDDLPAGQVRLSVHAEWYGDWDAGMARYGISLAQGLEGDLRNPKVVRGPRTQPQPEPTPEPTPQPEPQPVPEPQPEPIPDPVEPPGEDEGETQALRYIVEIGVKYGQTTEVFTVPINGDLKLVSSPGVVEQKTWDVPVKQGKKTINVTITYTLKAMLP